MAISLLAYVTTFSGQLYFRRSSFLDFFRVTTSTQHLLYRSTYFVQIFEELLFQHSHFFAAIIFLEQLLFQSDTSTEQLPLEKRNFFREVTFRNSYLFGRGIVQNKDIYRSVTFLKQVPLHSINFYKRAIFWKKRIFQKSNIPHYPLFLESYLFRVATFSKYVIFCSSYLFRRATFSQHNFSEDLLFHSYASFPQLQFLFIS